MPPVTTTRSRGLVDDVEPLNGARVDIGARVGWVLRMARLVGGGSSLEAMARDAGTSTTQLHRIETGAARRGVVTDAYERVLGLPEAMLRAPIDVACRTFRYAARDTDPGEPVVHVRAMSALTEAVSQPYPSGGAWLRWARALSQSGAIGLPAATATDLVGRLVGELCRSVGHAYPSRYEALSLLRCSAYGEIVLEVVQGWLGDPHVQVIHDAMSAIGEHPSAEATRWCTALLDDDNDLLVAGAALALEAMGDASEGTAFWEGLVPDLLEVLERSDPDSEAHRAVSHLVRVVPRGVWAGIGSRPTTPLAALPDIPVWSRSRDNRYWTDCDTRARDICATLGVPHQPMLSRLLFDLAIGPFEGRAVTSYMLLGAVPGLPAQLAAHLSEIAASDPDELIRERAGRRLAGCLHGVPSPAVPEWLRSGTPLERRWAFRLAGAAGEVLDDDVVCAGIEHGSLYAAGMAGHPGLADLAADETAPGSERGAAGWWAGLGSRIVD